MPPKLLKSDPNAHSEKEQEPEPGDTPTGLRQTNNIAFPSASLAVSREALMDDQPHHIPEVSWNDLRENFLPSIHPALSLQKTMKALLNAGLIRKVINTEPPQYYWKFFGNAFKEGENESVRYKRLQEIYNSVVAHAQPNTSGQEVPPRTLKYCAAGNCTPHSQRDNTSRPDAFTILNNEDPTSSKKFYDLKSTNGGDAPSWFDIATAEEFKLNDTPNDVEDDFKKIVWSLQHILQNDPRRRFVFGTTIEKRNVRVWYGSRQWILRTEPFDLLLSVGRLTQLILALSFADSTSLGWDPTVVLQRPRTDPSIPTYRITVNTTVSNIGGRTQPHIFQSVGEVLFHSCGIRGRATRVFKVSQASTLSEVNYILKDNWIDKTRTLEGEIYKTILGQASEGEKKYFLTVHCHGVVRIPQLTSGNGLSEEDDTERMIKNFQLSSCPMVPLRSEGPVHVRPHNITHQIAPEGETQINYDLREEMNRQTNPWSLALDPKVHYRIVFKEVATSLYNMKSSKALFETLLDSVTALKIMFSKGYVHRDISPGNILRYKNQGILADLEYAKHMGSARRHKIRTGTGDFISGEAREHFYDFGSISHDWYYNPLHDLESIWWVAVWGILCLVRDNTADPSLVRADEYYPAFNKIVRGPRRGVIFLSPPLQGGIDSHFVQIITGSIKDPHVLAACKILEQVRVTLRELFVSSENGPTTAIDTRVFENCHDVVLDALRPLTNLPDVGLIPWAKAMENNILHDQKATKPLKLRPESPIAW